MADDGQQAETTGANKKSDSPRSPWFTPVDTDSLPLTEPHPAPIFDTGPHPTPLPAPAATATLERDTRRDIAYLAELADEAYYDDELSDPGWSSRPYSAPSIRVGLKWWRFLLLTLGVWAVAAAAGAGFYFWWFHAPDKAWTEFAVLAYVVVCTVAALVMAMIEARPNLTALAIAVMSAPAASGAGAAALYGMYVFHWLTP